MHSTTTKQWLAFAGTLATITGGAVVAAPLVSQEVIEARLETQIWTTYTLNPHLRQYVLQVLVQGDKATLSGRVEDAVSKDLARQIALNVAGIREVDNQIEVQADYRPPTRPGSRTYGEAIDDATVTAAVKSKLLWSKYANGLGTKVDTFQGRVTLQGRVDSMAAKELAGRLAMDTRGVTGVDNQLQLDANAAKSVGPAAQQSAADAGMGIADSWITAKVKSTFLYSNEVEGANISVSTHGGIVTLSGKLNSGAERTLAIDLAKNVRGVKQVRSAGLTF